MISSMPTDDSQISNDFVNRFLSDVRLISKTAVSRRYTELALYEYPFDLELLSASPLYRESRTQYLDLGGIFVPKVASVTRSLRAHDLFKNEIEYSPVATEISWIAQNSRVLHDPLDHIRSFDRFSGISVFHEQNHRILWNFLPPPPSPMREFCRYLNFAESLVVMLDLALADQVGPRFASSLERLKVIYRTGRVPNRWSSSKSTYRDYLVAAQFATYLILELIHPDDVLSVVDYVFPKQKSMNRDAVNRAFDINELFTRVTNPEWQKLNWKTAQSRLSKLHHRSDEIALFLPIDPLEFGIDEFALVREVLDLFEVKALRAPKR